MCKGNVRSTTARATLPQTGFTAQPCIHVEPQLIASSFTVGDERQGKFASTSAPLAAWSGAELQSQVCKEKSKGRFARAQAHCPAQG